MQGTGQQQPHLLACCCTARQPREGCGAAGSPQLLEKLSQLVDGCVLMRYMSLHGLCMCNQQQALQDTSTQLLGQ